MLPEDDMVDWPIKSLRRLRCLSRKRDCERVNGIGKASAGRRKLRYTVVLRHGGFVDRENGGPIETAFMELRTIYEHEAPNPGFSDSV